jgi:uncharacterized membrane protein
MIRAVQLVAAAVAGVLVGLLSLADDNPNKRLMAILLVAAAVPFGLMRHRAPWLWALIVAWPTVTLRFSNSGWHAVFLAIYSIVGVYAGDWAAQWWQETHPRVGYKPAGAARDGGALLSADGTRVAEDGLPPEMPGRF